MIERRKALLAAIDLKQDPNFDDSIQECINLCEALNIEVVETVVQVSRSIDPNYAFRSGKLEELKSKIPGIDLVIFYNNLNYKLLGRIQEYLECEVIDRTNLILDIFALRAKTKEAIIQTEMAKLRYGLPANLKGDDEDRMQGGGANNRGKGETRGAIHKRTTSRRLKDLQLELTKIEKERQEKANKRKKSLLKRVALVGYTNAGKSSLMNCLLDKSVKNDKAVFEEDMLFATLDTSIRRIKHQNYVFLLYDTVGFVSNLPHELIASFKSTLSATKEADLLLNIMDASNPANFQQKTITLATLKDIGSDDKPIIDVYNKIDFCTMKGQNEFEISTKTNYGIEKLLDRIVIALYPDELSFKCLIPYKDAGIINEYSMFCKIAIKEHLNDGILISISGAKAYLDNFRKYEVKE